MAKQNPSPDQSDSHPTPTGSGTGASADTPSDGSIPTPDSQYIRSDFNDSTQIDTIHINGTTVDDGVHMNTASTIQQTADDAVLTDIPKLVTDNSFIYGDLEANENDAYEVMTVYDPDAERFEDISILSDDEVVNCYAYSRKTGQPLEQKTLAKVSESLSNNHQFIWLGLSNPSLDTVMAVQQAFNLHDLALEDALSGPQRAKVEYYGNDTLFVVVQTAKLDGNRIGYGTTAIFMGKNYIITIRTGASNSYKPVRDHYHLRPEKLKMGPIFVLHAILDFIVDNYMPITDRLGSYLREQERNIFSYEFSKDTLKNLYELKSQLVHMRAVMMPVQDICNFFINHKKNELVSYFPNAVKPYFRDVNDHLLRSIDAVNGLNEMLSVAMDTYMAVVNMGQNEVVRKLAAWAGILAVPTAVAGIYGMNFKYMPELNTHYGYFVVIALIMIFCTILWYNFKRLKWL